MAVALDVGLMTRDLREVAAYARRAESIGFGRLWASETSHDAFLPLAVAAASTTRLGLGTAIAVAFPRSPMIVAHTAWDLQAASDGRLVLGLGTQVKGHNERRFSVPWGPPGPRIAEYVRALRAIWACWQHGTPLAFKGRFYRFDLMTPFFNPGPIAHPEIPVYIAAVNPHMCAVAGEVCDGLHVHSFHTAAYVRDVVRPSAETGLARAGRPAARFGYRAAVMVALGDTEEEQWRQARAVRQQIAFYASTRTYEPVLAHHGFADLLPRLHEKSLRGDWAGMAALVPDELVDLVAVRTTWDSLGARLRERYDGIVDRLQIYPTFQPSLDDPRLVAVVRSLAT